MAEPIPVTLKRGHTWRSGYLPWELCNMLNALAQTDLRVVQRGPVKKLGLDTQSRAKQDNQLVLAEETRVKTARKINKGLAMELAMSSPLTFVDHADQVKSFCKVNRRGMPHYFAPPYKPDIVVRPADGEPSFRIVCEVSANKEMDNATYRRQLEGAFAHASADHEKAGVDVTYAFVVNLRKIGEDKALQKIYREVLDDPENGLETSGSIRIVPMRAGDFVTAIRRLEDEGNLSFDRRLFARALDALHEKIRAESPPEEEDWMARIFVDTVTAGSHPNLDAFDGGPAAANS